MRFCFIGSGIERENTRLEGIEVSAVARLMAERFDTLVFGGSNIGIMGAFARAFAACGGKIESVAPQWLEAQGLVYGGCEPTWCRDLAERKNLMFAGIDAVLCYPGGLGTWDELFDLLARRAVDSDADAPPIYLYNWEKYYAPLLLQIETALELGLIHCGGIASIIPFESVEQLAQHLQARQASVFDERRSIPSSP
jgi:uncharacterized protein (TIGR00730 family)